MFSISRNALGRLTQTEKEMLFMLASQSGFFLFHIYLVFKKTGGEMSQPKTSQNKEELLSYSCYGTGWFESVHMKLWLNAISHGSQWITTKRMGVFFKEKKHCLCSCCLCQVASESISVLLMPFKTVQGRGKQGVEPSIYRRLHKCRRSVQSP